MPASPPHSGPPPRTEFRWPLRVYYEDTDAGGVVYYANYLKFCERARTEWLRSLGVAQGELVSSQGVAFVVRSLAADYLAGAALDDSLEVVTAIERLGGASIVFAQQIWRAGALLFEARVTVACVDWNRKRAAPIPATLRQQLAALN